MGKYKENILFKLVDSENITKAIVNKNESYLDTSLSVDPISLIYKNIFPYKRVPDINEETETFITLRVGGFKLINGIYKSGYIIFYVFTHNSLMKTSYGMTRVDYIIGEIDELFNKATDIGGRNLIFDGMDEFDIHNNYSGSWIRYKIMDFN